MSSSLQNRLRRLESRIKPSPERIVAALNLHRETGELPDPDDDEQLAELVRFIVDAVEAMDAMMPGGNKNIDDPRASGRRGTGPHAKAIAGSFLRTLDGGWAESAINGRHDAGRRDANTGGGVMHGLHRRLGRLEQQPFSQSDYRAAMEAYRRDGTLPLHDDRLAELIQRHVEMSDLAVTTLPGMPAHPPPKSRGQNRSSGFTAAEERLDQQDQHARATDSAQHIAQNKHNSLGAAGIPQVDLLDQC